MAVALSEEEAEDAVKTVLKNLSDYLHKHLPVDRHDRLISGLKRKQLLDASDASRLDALARAGDVRAVDGLLDYMSSYYDEEMLEKFCSFLDESSKPAKPRFRDIAQKIREEMKKLQPTPTHPAQTDVDSQPDLPSSPPTTQGESTSAQSTGDERSQKIKEVVEIYRKNEEVHLPCVPVLEETFDDIMATLGSNLFSADPKTINRLHTKIRSKYRRYIHGMRPSPLPDVPETPRGILDFIAEKSNPLEILLVHYAVHELKDKKDPILINLLEKYEDELAKHLETTMLSLKSRGVTLLSHMDHIHMAVVLRKKQDQVFLSLVLHIKKYLVKMLHLEEALFEGFAGGCTILFFSILRIDAIFLSPKVISHLSELKRKFEITHVVVFGYFACDLEQGSVEILSEGDDLRLELKEAEEKSEQLQYDLIAAKSEGDDLRLELKEAEEKSEQIQYDLTAAKSEGDDLRLELKEAEEKSEQLQYDLTAAKDHIANVKCSLCKDHLEIFETIKKSLEETASSFPDVLQVEKAVTVLSASEKLTEELSASKVKLEEQLLSSKEELSSLRSACKELEDIPSPTEEQKEILSGHKVKMESLESTSSSIQLEYAKVEIKLKFCEMGVLGELLLKVSQVLAEATHPMPVSVESYLPSYTGKVTGTWTGMEDVLEARQGASFKQDYDTQGYDFDIPQAAAAQEFYDEFDAVPESSREKSHPPEFIPDCASMFEKETYRNPSNPIEEAEYDISDESGDKEDKENKISVDECSTDVSSVSDSNIKFDGTVQYVAQKPEKVHSQYVPNVSLTQHLQAQSTTAYGGNRANLDPSKLKRVCHECWKDLAIHHMNAKTGCCGHQKVHPLAWGQSPQNLDGCRPRTSASIFTLCKNEYPCPWGKQCLYAHGRKELEYWKASLATATCKECLDKNIRLNADLVVNKCLNERHAHIPMVVVYEDDMEKVLQLIRCPTKTQIMKGKRSNHNFHNCGMEDPSACDYPHNKIEEMLWCKWKENNYASLDPIAVYDSPEKLIEFHGLLASLCGGCSPVKTRVSSAGAQIPIDDVSEHLPSKPVNSSNVLECELSANNYRDKFNALIACEQSTHEEFLKRCDGEYFITFYTRDDIRSNHYWYLAMIMEQYIADNVRQAATHVILKYGSMSFKAGLLPPQRFTHRGEPCLIIGFMKEENVPPYSPTRLLHAELKQRGRINVVTEFQLKVGYFINLRRAINNIPSAVIQKLTIEVPRPADYVLIKDVPNRFPGQFQLDEGQLKSCQKVLSCSPSLPFTIVGPFGTGKTRVIAVSALWLLLRDRSTRILIATHHKRTADEYIEKYFTADIRNKVLPGVRVIRLLGKNAPMKKGGLYSDIVRSAWTVQGSLHHYQVIITTFITSMGMSNPGRFTHIFIDEGAQTREPECVAAFRFATPETKIVIAGDHKQVGPGTSVLGEDARKYGLSMSLLERLDSLYQQADLKKAYQAVLLNNYRCHSAILCFPSELFYHSSVKHKSADNAAHPDWKFPLQFVCTSLEKAPSCKWSTGEELKTAARMEIQTVKALVQQCVDNWPVGWGENKLSKICVMTPTRYAEWLWKTEVSKTDLQRVTTAVTFDIQGLEYRAVFVCTSEPVNGDFSPFDPVKSLCDPRVFNTIITRSQSLVIVVGNPFRLMKIEEQIPEGNKQCWLSYFQRCWEGNALTVFKGLPMENQRNRKDFGEMILQKENSTLHRAAALMENTQDLGESDTILNSYEEMNEADATENSFPKSHGWHYNMEDNKQRFVCKAVKDTPKHWGSGVYHLRETAADHCVATSLGSTKPPLVINGIDDRRCAFDKAMVQVAGRDAYSGVVFAVIKQGNTRPVVCTVDPKDPQFFLPVNKCSPRIKSVSDTMHSDRQGLPREQMTIECFEPASLKGTHKVTHSIPMDVAVNVSFLVQPLAWKVFNRYPQGAAIAVFPRGAPLSLADSLLQVTHGRIDNPNSLSVNDLFISEQLPRSNALAILQPDGVSTCAFSVECEKEAFLVRFHVVNVADSLKLPPTHSVSTWSSGKVKCHTLSQQWDILPKDVINSLSFADKSIQNTITLEYKVSRECFDEKSRGMILMHSKVKVEPGSFTTSVVHCDLLTMEGLQDLITSVSCGPVSRRAVSENLTLFDNITILYSVAKELHKIRLGLDGYHPFESGVSGYPEAEKIVNEFCIQASYSAALLLSKIVNGQSLQKRQYPIPGHEHDVSVMFEKLKRSSTNQLLTSDISAVESLHILPSVLKKVIAALEECQVLELKQNLCQVYPHPQFAVILSDIMEVLLPEEYYVADGQNEKSKPYLKHYAHCSPQYASFTSPFQCIADIFVQEGILSALRDTQWKRTPEELKGIANLCNSASTKAAAYKAAMSDLELAMSAQQSSIAVEAFVKQRVKNTLKLCYLPPNVPHSAIPHKIEVYLPEMDFACFRLLIKSARGIWPLYSWIPTQEKSSSSVYLAAPGPYLQQMGLKEPEVLRITLDPQVLKKVKECFMDIVKGPDLAKELEGLLPQNKIIFNRALFADLQVPIPHQPHQVVRLWLGCDHTTSVLSVQPQCMELASDVRVCLQHMRDPLSCFTQHPTERASKKSYSSLAQYVRLWERAVLATSAELGVNSTQSGSSLVYKDVVLKFSEFIIPPKILTPEMYVPVGEITASFTNDCICMDFFTIEEGDFACVRYEIDLNQEQLKHLKKEYQDYLYPASGTVGRAVLHMVVDRVTHKNEAVQVKFTAAGTQPLVSPLMKEILQKNHFPCEVEVITMPHSLRNCFQLLSSKDVLAKASECALHVAMGNLRQLLSKTKGSYFDFIKYLTGKYHSFRELARQLSQAQCNAVNIAMKHSFQLIHSSNGAERLLGTALVVAFVLWNKEQSIKKPTISSQCKCVLYCCPDEGIAREVADSLGSRFEDIRVLLVNSRQTFCAGKEIFGENAAEVPPRITGSLHYSLISRVRRVSSHARMIREMESKIYHRSESDKFPSLSQIMEYQQYIWKAEKEILSQGFDIVVCTASEASSERIRQYFQPVQVVVYNASLITEPETFSAIHQASHVVLIGDHHQHRPLLNSDVSAQNGMHVSLFERLYKVIEDAYNGEVATCPLLSTLK